MGKRPVHWSKQSCAQMPTGVMTLLPRNPIPRVEASSIPGAVGEENSETPEDTPAKSSALLGARGGSRSTPHGQDEIQRKGLGGQEGRLLELSWGIELL